MNKTYLISQTSSFTLLILISFVFAIIGIYYSKKFKGINNYLTANRSVGLFSLTTSLTASALGLGFYLVQHQLLPGEGLVQ